MLGKSILAVVAGVLFTVVVTTGVDVVLHQLRVFPPVGTPLTDATALIASSYRVVITVLAGWLTARLAPADPMRHALILGVIGTLLGAAGAAATWNQDMGPRWYAVSLAVLAIPECWLGGWLHARSVSKAV